jgi:hypothetical protein
MVARILIALVVGTGAGAELHPVCCGPAALYFLMDRLDRPVSLEQAEQVLPTHEDGQNSFEELRDALVRRCALRSLYDNLRESGAWVLPAAGHLYQLATRVH